MAHQITHNYVSTKPDVSDPTVIGSSKWNANHNITIDLSDDAHLTNTLANAKLTNSSVTVGSTTVALGGTSLTLDGLTSVNKVTITVPSVGSTLTIADGKTFTASNTITLSGTDGSTLNVGTGGTLGTAAYTASTSYEPANANIQNHISSTSNPHSVTASQVGLGNVLNVAQEPAITKATGYAKWTGTEWSFVNETYEAANSNIQNHISSTSNPHSVTASQVGLGNVTNESKATMFSSPSFTTQATAPIFISTATTGTAPLTIASTTKVTNLNADLLDGKDIGTSGNTIPLLDGANTWSANNTFSTINKITFTQPATSATLTIADGKTFTINNTVTFNGTDSTAFSLPTVSSTLASTDDAAALAAGMALVFG